MTGFYCAISGLSYFGLAAAKGSPPAALEVINLLKLSSLVFLVIMGFYEGAKSNHVPMYLTYSNALIIVTMFIAMGLLFIKILSFDLMSEDLSYFPLFWFANKYAEVAAIIPLILYGILNLGASLYEQYYGGREDIASHSAIYLAISDVPCLISIGIIFALLSFMQWAGVVDQSGASMMLGGAMAMFIYASALLTVAARLAFIRTS